MSEPEHDRHLPGQSESIQIEPHEIRWRFSRSSGPGGQNVNKVETRAELLFPVASSKSLSAEARARLVARLSDRLDTEGNLRVASSTFRTQTQNREEALRRLHEILTQALKPRRVRRLTRVPRAVKEARLREKHHRSDRKRERQWRPDS